MHRPNDSGRRDGRPRGDSFVPVTGSCGTRSRRCEWLKMVGQFGCCLHGRESNTGIQACRILGSGQDCSPLAYLRRYPRLERGSRGL
jgi:hypothetical protein